MPENAGEKARLKKIAVSTADPMIDETSGETWTAKVPSTPEDSSVGVLNGVARICDESQVDPAQITSLFQNLILNGLKYNQSEIPTVEVGCRQLSDSYRFHVKDNGIGIAPEFHDRIFLLFQRLHTREEYSGNGLGLALCKRIVERHGGRIWLTSQAGQGTTFYFALKP